MRAYHVAGFLALFFWQAAPARMESTLGGRFRLALAGATDQWEDYHAYYDCNGNLTSEESSAIGMQSVGARADMFLGTGDSRLTVVAGRAASDLEGLGHGLFWGVEAVWEGPSLGAGVGYRDAGDAVWEGYRNALAFYLRYGKLDKAHVRMEVRPMSETPSLAGEARVGLGFGQGRRRQVSGFVGLVLGPTGCSENCDVAAFGDFGFPLAPSVDLLLRGVYGPGHITPIWGVGAGLRANWGR